MNSYEATSLLLSKIKNLDPENASKIMGYLLIQDFGEEDLTCLALSPETVLHSLILKVKSQLGLLSNNSSTPSSPSPLNPIARPTITTSNPFSKSLPRLLHNGFDSTMNPSSPSSNSSWQLSGFPNNPINSPKSSPLLSYDNIRAGSAPISPLLHRRRNGSNSNIPTDASNSTELIDEHHLNDYLSFLNESSSSSSRNQNNNGEDMSDPRLEFGPDVHKWAHCISNGDTSHIHRRSYSASDVCFGSEEGGLGIGYKPCLYYARGFCKNGSSCKFVHGGFADASMDGIGSVGPTLVGSPSKFEGMFERRDEFLRLKAAQQQQRLTAHLMGGVPPSSQYNKYMNFLLQQQNDPQRATFMMEEEFHNLGLCQSERNEFLAMAAAEKRNSASRQIYLTFPADSTFKDEDVSEYFSKFGPVQDVRIPYQQKRMFGFVTFVYPETVKLILTKGNPHFICDSRVLVKPYKEKGKIPDKRQQHQQQQFERGEFSPCLSPSALESRDPFDLRIGARMLYNTQDMLIRRKLEEQAELQQAIELHERRLMNLHLPDLNERAHHHRHSLSIGSPLSSEARLCINQSDLTLSDCIDQEISQEHINSQNKSSGKSKEENSNSEKPSSNNTSMEQVLPDSLFASPKKSRTDLKTEFPIASLEVGDKSSLPSNSNSDSASL